MHLGAALGARGADWGSIIPGMTEPTPTGALACPFVAFEDDRDARADAPDHRHRCYAEVRPAPRAIAHQEAFCLSPGFAACPTFQDWARREAARAKPSASAEQDELAGLARPGRGQKRVPPADAGGDDDQFDARSAPASDPPSDVRPDDVPAGRPKSRDWAAPPVWVGGSEEGAEDAEAPAFLAGAPGSGAPDVSAGLAGSRWLNEARSSTTEDPDLNELDRSVEADRAARKSRGPAARQSRDSVVRRGPPVAPDDDLDDESSRPVASAVASPGRRANQASRRPVPAAREAGRPAWERSRRNEAYPTLKTRIGMPAIPRVALALGALLIAAIVMISLPFLLNLGGSPSVSTPSTSVAPADSGAPSSEPSASIPLVASPQTYTVVSGDTITKIARQFSLTTAQLLAANPQIKNANSIKPGDKITIPSSAPSDVITGASPSSS